MVYLRWNVHVGPYKPWFEHGAGYTLPDMSEVIGRDILNPLIDGHVSTDSVWIYIYGISHSEYEEYVDALIESGFKNEFRRSDDSYRADHIKPLNPKRVSISWYEEDSKLHVPYVSLSLM